MKADAAEGKARRILAGLGFDKQMQNRRLAVDGAFDCLLHGT